MYDELRKLATARLVSEKPGQTLQATALVHEAYLRLVVTDSSQQWQGRGHFFGAAAEAMRRILVEKARRKNTQKRWPEKAKLVKLRYFAGLTTQEAADALGLSVRTAERTWAYAKVWLLHAIEGRG